MSRRSPRRVDPSRPRVARRRGGMLEGHEHAPSPMVGAGQQCCACFQFTDASTPLAPSSRFGRGMGRCITTDPFGAAAGITPLTVTHPRRASLWASPQWPCGLVHRPDPRRARRDRRPRRDRHDLARSRRAAARRAAAIAGSASSAEPHGGWPGTGKRRAEPAPSSRSRGVLAMFDVATTFHPTRRISHPTSAELPNHL